MISCIKCNGQIQFNETKLGHFLKCSKCGKEYFTAVGLTMNQIDDYINKLRKGEHE